MKWYQTFTPTRIRLFPHQHTGIRLFHIHTLGSDYFTSTHYWTGIRLFHTNTLNFNWYQAIHKDLVIIMLTRTCNRQVLGFHMQFPACKKSSHELSCIKKQPVTLSCLGHQIFRMQELPLTVNQGVGFLYPRKIQE